jgi:phage-related protein
LSETVTWIDPDGASTTLNGGPDTFVTWDVSGRFAPPARFDEEGIPGGDGSSLRAVRHDTREFTLPVWIEAPDQGALRAAKRALVRSMNPKRGDGLIRVTSPIGDQREIVCRVAAGLEGVERIDDTSGLWMQMFPLVFRANNPYWRDISDIAATYTVGTPSTFFPFFPIRLSNAQVFTDASPDNVGDVDAWPVWTLTGPGSTIYLRNLTTGYVLNLATTLGSGESAVIDTRPGAKTVTKADGTNLFSQLSNSSFLWPLEPGVNSLRIEMSGATAASSVSMAFRPHYLSP